MRRATTIARAILCVTAGVALVLLVRVQWASPYAPQQSPIYVAAYVAT